MADEPPEVDSELADQPVGYGKPPYEYRWPKGYCPNRAGRPKRKKIMPEVSPLNAFQRRLLKQALTVVAEVDGEDFTLLDSALLQLRTSTRPEDRKLQLALYKEALEADHAWRERAVSDLIAYKEHWGPIFTQRQLLGQKLPQQYPDPHDIVILSTTEFRFLGPVTADEAADWEYLLKMRGSFFLVADDIVEAAGLFRPIEEDHQHYLKLRRNYYRINRQLPKAFKKKHAARFPAFKPPTVPPEWYRDEDEWDVPEKA